MRASALICSNSMSYGKEDLLYLRPRVGLGALGDNEPSDDVAQQYGDDSCGKEHDNGQ